MTWSSRVSFVLQVCVHQVHQVGKGNFVEGEM